MFLSGRRHAPHAAHDTTDQELQTDTMRFVAILALALMAIFALVRGVPLRPVQTPGASDDNATASDTPTMRPTPVPTPTPTPSTPPRSASEVPRPTAPAARPQPEPTSRPRVATAAAASTPPKPRPEPRSATPEQAPAASALPPRPAPTKQAQAPQPPAPQPASGPPSPKGFTLRFASAQALTHLVATGRVRMYARDPLGAFHRVELVGARVRLRKGPGPAAYHEMETGTVPDTFLRAAGADGRLTWGVTLPPNLERRIAALIHSHQGGTIEIDAAGHVRLRKADR